MISHLEMKPSDYTIRTRLAKVFWYLGEISEAEINFERAIADVPAGNMEDIQYIKTEFSNLK